MTCWSPFAPSTFTLILTLLPAVEAPRPPDAGIKALALAMPAAVVRAALDPVRLRPLPNRPDSTEPRPPDRFIPPNRLIRPRFNRISAARLSRLAITARAAITAAAMREAIAAAREGVRITIKPDGETIIEPALPASQVANEFDLIDMRKR